MQNRTEMPPLQSIDKINFVKPTIYRIQDGINLYHMAEVPNETGRLDLYFDAGTARGNRSIAGIVNGLLLTGNEKWSAVQIQNEIDALGGFLESGISQEGAVLTVYALKDKLLPILNIITRALEALEFTDQEVNELLSDRTQKFKVNMEKVSFLAQREFQKRLFDQSVYGRITEIEDYQSVDRNELIHFFRENYLHGLHKMALVGALPQEDIQEVIRMVSKYAKTTDIQYEKVITNKKGSNEITKEGALQTAIRVGRILFNKKHTDYLDMMVLNTILGDYFGSRLMSNIREDKGYTYGIGSMIAELHETGYFLIATEVGKDVKHLALCEIQKEIERLQNKLVSEEELDLVKNYMLGQLLKGADGPYSMLDLYLSVEPYGMDLDFYNRAIESVHAITPERIQILAKTYLNWEDLTVVLAG